MKEPIVVRNLGLAVCFNHAFTLSTVRVLYRQRGFGRVLHKSATAVKLFPMLLSTPGGWHPDLYRVMRSIAVSIASRTLNSLQYASQTLFQRHVAFPVANNAAFFISGFDLRI